MNQRGRTRPCVGGSGQASPDAEIARRADIKALVPIETARQKFGANHDARVPAEHLIVARTPI